MGPKRTARPRPRTTRCISAHNYWPVPRPAIRVRGGIRPGPLAGVPFAVKNLFDLAGLTTLAGSRILASRSPAKADAYVIRRLCVAGAIPVGALNMEEFAYGFMTDNAHHGRTLNPHDPARTAGGSSGGSGAAVGAGLVPLALGSDTNGSIRVPAAFCACLGSSRPTAGCRAAASCRSCPASTMSGHLRAVSPTSRPLTTRCRAMTPPTRSPAAGERNQPSPALPRACRGCAWHRRTAISQPA
jgi:Asp-tRNA(Asn)/Glu-tRNA(Gln) amidotransferase A subunit family amidase